MKSLLSLFTLSCLCAQAGTLFLGAYPDSLMVVDESSGKVLEHIPLTTGLPTSLRLSHDRKTIYVTTNDHAGVEVVDVATRKVTNHFVLNHGNKTYRFGGGAPDPDGKFLYSTTTEMTKLADRYEIGKQKYTVIDLAQQKIARTMDMPREAENAAQGFGGGGGGRGGGFEVSPDGKYLYQFGNQVTVLSSADFSVVEKIDLAQPEAPAMENLGLGGILEAISEPGQRFSVFNFSDPLVHNRVFGIAHFDLNTRKFDFTAIGPAPPAMTGLHVTPDKKNAYTVITNGAYGNKRCEFWAFDLASNHLSKTGDVPCRSRFSFGMSSDGKKLYIYGAGFEIDVYDAATFRHEATWNLNNDMTGGGLIVMP